MTRPLASVPRVLAAALLAAAAASTAGAQDSPELLARAKAIHAKAIKIDTHVDFDPADMTGPAPNYVTGMPRKQVDLPKMANGGLDAVFFSIYVGQRDDFTPAGYAAARASNVAKFEAVQALTSRIAPDKIGLARTAADVRRLHAEGKLVALMGVENGYGIGEELSAVKRYADYGARYLSMAHNGHSQLSDSNTGERDGVWKWNGLSPLGKQVVAEANRWGILVDVSHPSKQANLQAIALSQAPVIASHSGVRALCDHSRNLDDEQLLAIKKNGGVVQLVAFNSYVKTPPPASPERTQALAALRAEFGMGAAGGGGGGAGAGRAGGMPDSVMARFRARMSDLDAKFPPPPRATVKDFVDHIDYAVRLIGLDHVAISSDFDGGGGIDGWNRADESINVTTELVRRGYTEAQIIALWGGNTLRVLERAEQVAARLQRTANR